MTRILGLFDGLLGLLESKFQMDYWRLLWLHLFSDYSDYWVLIIGIIQVAIDIRIIRIIQDYSRLLFCTWIIRIIVNVCNDTNNRI